MVVDILLALLGLVLIVVGILGCVLPVIPGPPISFLGLLVLHLTEKVQFSNRFLLLMAGIAIFVTVLDYIVPIWGTKKFGGTKRGTWGATIGLIIGLFFGPPGIIIGPFAGAFLGELSGGRDQKSSLRAGFGAFIGFLMGVGIKLVASGIMAWHFFITGAKGFFG